VRSVYRYEVPVDDGDHTHTLTGPIVHVDCRRHGLVEFWAIHSGVERGAARRFRAYGTGAPVPPGHRHVGTALDGPLVWHLFEVPIDGGLL
jgi:hypothetical protein